MTSKIAICNTALIALGDSPIAAFPPTETTTRAKQCANIYDDVRDSTLRAHPWSCARKRVILSPDVAAPAFEFSYQFTLPADCLRVLSITENAYIQTDYRIESGKLLCNEAAVYLTYIWRNDEPASYDGLLISALSAAIGARLAYAIPGSASLMQMFDAMFNRAINEAKGVNGAEYPFPDMPESSMVSVRAIG